MRCVFRMAPKRGEKAADFGSRQRSADVGIHDQRWRKRAKGRKVEGAFRPVYRHRTGLGNESK